MSPLPKRFPRLRHFLADDRATETLEWGLLCGMIIAGAVAVITIVGPKIQRLWNELNNSIPD